MKNNMKLFKTITKEEFSKLKCKVSREYYYFAETDLKELKEQKFENSNNNKIYQLVDEDYEWNPKQQSAYLNLKISLDNVGSLFGLEGSAYSDSILGVGIIWKPERSRIKRCYKLGEISSKTDSITLKSGDIELSNITSNVSFSLIIYIVKPGTKEGNRFFGNEEGLILYQEELWDILIDGNASIFPIFEVDDEGGPLWSYYCDSDYIEEDYFDDEHIRININKKHSAYDMIHPKSQNYNPTLVNEILSSAITLIILDLRKKQQDDLFDDNVEYSNKSIMQVMIYFRDKLGFKINDSYAELLNSVKLYFDREV